MNQGNPRDPKDGDEKPYPQGSPVVVAKSFPGWVIPVVAAAVIAAILIVVFVIR